MRAFSNYVRAGAITLVAATAMSIAPTSVSFGQEFVAIKGGQVGGAFNRWTSAWAAYLTKALEGYDFSSESSTGSAENVRAVGDGNIEFGLAFASDIYLSYRGEGDFTQPLTDLRAISFFFASVGHFVVAKDSDFNTLEDIAGKRVSLGGPGSGSAKNITLLLEHMGLFDDFTPVYLGGKSGQALNDGEIDAFNWHPGLGNAMIRDTATTMDIRFIDLDEPAKKSGFYEKYPYFGQMTIPAGLYNNVDVDTLTFGTGSLMITNANVSADLVYNMLKALDSEEGRKEVGAAVGEAAVAAWNKDDALNFMTIPLHEGAQRFWKEKGVEIPENLMSK
jgi:TRAP transporter TAXI family solute receptor